MSNSKKEFKGKSIIDFPDEFVVIDTETTGLDSGYDQIIEIGALKIENGNIVDKFSSLIKPNPRYTYDESSNSFSKPTYICDFITNLTGITNEMLSNAPEPKDVLPDLNNFINDCIIVGHNVNFDINFLYEAYMNTLGVPFSNDFIDTMRISRRLLKELKHHRLSDIVDYFKLSYDGAHRAITDCILTNDCFKELKKMVLLNYSSIEAFQEEFKKHNNTLKGKDITTNKTDFNIYHPLYGKCCVFTGTLQKFSRKEAMQFVVDFGGNCGDSVTKKTNFLILGSNDYRKSLKGAKSTKQKRAEQLILENYDIQIISENVFYEMINLL